MDLATLEGFCSVYAERIATPWNKDGFTFATDGYILIRVPLMAGVPERINHPEDVNLIAENPEPTGGFIHLPSLESMGVTICPRCKGNPPDSEKCPECEGRCEVELSNSHSDYTVECKSCEGEGEVDGCKRCKGIGYLMKEDRVEIAGCKYQTINLIAFSRHLPNCSIAPGGKGKASWIHFDGGDGLIMPTMDA